ncbi:FAD-binding oxidoreductase, partial [Thermococcus sp. Bubb.Bath]|uniref:NAD(P)/FAD-dependent oxidoreductase n=2 Tax=Thermococcus TaxID=2263 RepID=UPI00143991C9
TNRGVIKTGIVVNATNAWAKLINAMAGIKTPIPIEPYKHQAVITQPIRKGAIKPMVISFKYGHAYLTQTSHGGVVGGVGYELGPTYDLNPTYEFMREVSYYFTRIIPALRELLILRTWAGYYAKTPDSNPAIGKIGELNDY